MVPVPPVLCHHQRKPAERTTQRTRNHPWTQPATIPLNAKWIYKLWARSQRCHLLRKDPMRKELAFASEKAFLSFRRCSRIPNCRLHQLVGVALWEAVVRLDRRNQSRRGNRRDQMKQVHLQCIMDELFDFSCLYRISAIFQDGEAWEEPETAACLYHSPCQQGCWVSIPGQAWEHHRISQGPAQGFWVSQTSSEWGAKWARPEAGHESDALSKMPVQGRFLSWWI